MTGREELLTEHAMQWSRRKIEGLAHYLAKRYEKVFEMYKVYHSTTCISVPLLSFFTWYTVT